VPARTDNGIRHLLTAGKSDSTRPCGPSSFGPTRGSFATIEEAQSALDHWDDYRAGRWLARELVEVNLRDGLLEISHRGVIVATHAHILRPEARKEPYMTSSPRRMGARSATVGTSVLRVVDTSGSVCFAGATYRVGNPCRRKQFSV
jgi:hypothetical protein